MGHNTSIKLSSMKKIAWVGPNFVPVVVSRFCLKVFPSIFFFFIYFIFSSLFISYFYWVLLLFVAMDLILYFILRDFVPLPSKQNIFLAPYLDFSLAKIIGDSSEFFWKRIPSCFKTFYFLFCFVWSVSFYVLLYYVINYLEEGFLFYLLRIILTIIALACM